MTTMPRSTAPQLIFEIHLVRQLLRNSRHALSRWLRRTYYRSLTSSKILDLSVQSPYMKFCPNYVPNKAPLKCDILKKLKETPCWRIATIAPNRLSPLIPFLKYPNANIQSIWEINVHCHIDSGSPYFVHRRRADGD